MPTPTPSASSSCCARKGRELDLGARERHRAGLRILEQVGVDAVLQRGLLRLVFPDRRMARDHVRHLVRQHGGELRGVVGERQQSAGDVELAVRQREGVDRRRVEDGDLVLQARPLGGRDQLVHRLGDEAFEPRVLVGAAVGRQNAVVLALRRRVASACFGGLSGRLTGVVMRSKVGAAREQQRKRRRGHQARRGPPSGSHCDSHNVPPTSCSVPLFARDVPPPPRARPVPRSTREFEPVGRSATSAPDLRRQTRAHCAWRS